MKVLLAAAIVSLLALPAFATLDQNQTQNQVDQTTDFAFPGPGHGGPGGGGHGGPGGGGHGPMPGPGGGGHGPMPGPGGGGHGPMPGPGHGGPRPGPGPRPMPGPGPGRPGPGRPFPPPSRMWVCESRDRVGFSYRARDWNQSSARFDAERSCERNSRRGGCYDNGCYLE